MRGIDALVVESGVKKVSGLLTETPLRFKHQGLTLVAKKSAGGQVTVITAWKHRESLNPGRKGGKS